MDAICVHLQLRASTGAEVHRNASELNLWGSQRGGDPAQNPQSDRGERSSRRADGWGEAEGLM